MHLTFDDAPNERFKYGEGAPEAAVNDSVSGANFKVRGMATRAPGVVGNALRFDGFTTYVEGFPRAADATRILNDDEDGAAENDDGLEMPREISIEAWVALGAYPWNWAPILTIGQYEITGLYFGIDSSGRVGFHVSDATSVWHECNSSIDATTRLGLPLNEWCHVVGTYSPQDGLAVYINGEQVATYNDFQFDYGIVYSQLDDGFRIGRNRVDLPPSDPIRDWATYPSQYSFDGIIDELKVFAQALTAQQVADLYASTTPQHKPLFEPRRFPQIPSSGRFAANYTCLKYYPQWDSLWPPWDNTDVVMQFDSLPVKLVFWRGTRYSPCWVTENGKWMADQSRETGNNWFLMDGPRESMPTGCIEHMSDTQCRSSRVTIVESNEARCVINWRYLQMDVKLRQQSIANESGFGEWGDEYYYVYPDGVAVRAVRPGYGGWQETIFLNEPGTRPEDNIELEACTLLNMRGESETYSWEHGYPEFDLDDAVIQLIHLKSSFKPFLIFREGGGFDVFNLEVRPEYSHFPWWNHWPVAQVISDGRSASAPDRASHSSLSWGDPNGDAALYGMTSGTAEALVNLARSWNHPPKLTVLSGDYDNHGYDYTQRAYVLASNKGGPLKIRVAATEQSPLVNLAVVINNWTKKGESVDLVIDGQAVARGKAARLAIEYDVSGKAHLVLWIRKHSTKPVQIELTTS